MCEQGVTEKSNSRSIMRRRFGFLSSEANETRSALENDLEIAADSLGE
jgi:hypothetical protein